MDQDYQRSYTNELPYYVGSVFKMLYDFPTSLVISDDGQKILYENQNRLMYVDAHSTKTIRNQSLFMQFIGLLDLNHTNDKVLAGSADGQTLILDLKTGNRLHNLDGHPGFVIYGGFNPQSTIAATSCQDMIIRTWDVISGRMHVSFDKHKQTPNYLSFNAEGDKILSCSYEKDAIVWNAEHGEIICKLANHTMGLEVSKFASSGYICATGSHDNTANVWDIRRPSSPLFVLKGHSSFVKELAFNNQMTQIVTSSNDNTGRIYNLSDGSFVKELSGFPGQVYAVNFNQSGNKIIAASNSKFVQIFDNQGNCIQQIKDEGNVYINKTGNTFVTMPKAIDSQAKVWREKTIIKN